MSPDRSSTSPHHSLRSHRRESHPRFLRTGQASCCWTTMAWRGARRAAPKRATAAKRSGAARQAVREGGVEPPSPACHAGVLPLDYRRLRPQRRGSHPPRPWLTTMRPARCLRWDACGIGVDGRTRTGLILVHSQEVRLFALVHSRGGGDRTHDLTVPNRARCRCATPR